MMPRVSRCQCGYDSCQDWHVSGYAQVQGVKFSEQQAKAVAALMEDPESMRRLAREYDAVQAVRDLENAQFQIQALRETCEELMTGSGAGNVLESLVALEETDEARGLMAALTKYGKAKGWT